MKRERLIAALEQLGQWMAQDDPALGAVIAKARHQNAWFTEPEVRHALRQWSSLLQKEKLNEWLEPYPVTMEPLTIGVVNAGNIPLVGFHDLLAVLVSGNRYQGKNASDDSILLPYLVERLIGFEPDLASWISFVPRLQHYDAVIATGSNNSARYFHYYFSSVPHVIRKNRNGVAVLDGKETTEQLQALGEDVFRYFGLGCRSVSHLFLPEEVDFSKLFGAFESHADIFNHHKYANNVEYYRAVLTLKKVPFLDNGFLLVKKDDQLASPVSILNYSFYSDKEAVQKVLAEKSDLIQCVVSSSHLPFGTTQSPALDDYADGVNTLEFLTSIGKRVNS